MSAKNKYTNLLKPQPFMTPVVPNTTLSASNNTNTYIFSGESESDDWNLKPIDLPIFAGGAGAYSEESFGFYVGSGKINKLLLNSFPVSGEAIFKIKLRIIGKEVGEIYDLPDIFEFTGKMDTVTIDYVLPFADNQVVVYSSGSENYPQSLARVRFNMFICA